MADALLRAAEAQLQEAEAMTTDYDDREGDPQLVVYAKACEAWTSAQKALVEFRRTGNAEGRIQALGALVKACSLTGDDVDACRSAVDELAMMKRSGNKEAIARMTEMVIACETARGDGAAALSRAEELVELWKELGDRAGEAKALQIKAQLLLQLGQPQAVLHPAEEAVKLFRELDDLEGEEAATRILSQAYCLKGRPDRAPGREQALRALEDLGKALVALDEEAWAGATARLGSSGAWTDGDLEDIINKAFAESMDQRVLRRFLEERGIGAQRLSGTGRALASEVGHCSSYLKSRANGMCYGPQFRCVSQRYIVGLESEALQYSHAVVQLSDGAGDDWHTDMQMQFAPGILDGMMQNSQAFQSF